MQSSGFGRKGLGDGAAMPQPGAVPAQRFGAADDSLAAKRSAFIAAERALAAQSPQTVDYRSLSPADHLEQSDTQLRQSGHQASAKQKSLLWAYFYWYFAGAISAHRFYLGDTSSAIKQCGAFVGGLFILFIGTSIKVSLISGIGVICLLGAVAWLLADMFFIPGLCRKANAARTEPARYFD